MVERIIAAGVLGSFMLVAGAVATDQLVFKPEAKELAQKLATRSMTADAPDSQTQLASDLMDYRGRSHFFFMEHMQNARDFKTAADFGITFWRLEDPEEKAAVDLGTSKGRRIFDITKEFLSAKVINTAAIIDNRDPARGPVFVHDGLEQSQLDAAMGFLNDKYGSAANMPRALIGVSYYDKEVTIFEDPDGADLSKSPYAPHIKLSPWNPKLAHKGVLEKGRHLIEKGF
ncbi:MAG: hypothetical protein LRZ85_10075 [Alphaproteobacteria bacterium]|nr:hypothetical protein [Alphaproteobacteria bacterium]